MGLGRMTQFIDIVEVVNEKDTDGFMTQSDKNLASVRAYREDQRGTESWRNRAVFSSANALFRLRTIPGLKVTPAMFILSDGDRYNITAVNDVRNRGLYLEILAEKIGTSKGGAGFGNSNSQNTG